MRRAHQGWWSSSVSRGGFPLKSEQQRITRQLNDANRRIAACQIEFETIEANLAATLKLAQNCQRAYKAGSPLVRRLLNQALFERIEIDDDYEVRSEMAPPFKLLLGPVKQLALSEENEVLSLDGRRVYRRQMPGRELEPVAVGDRANFFGHGSKEALVVVLAEQLQNPEPDLVRAIRALES